MTEPVALALCQDSSAWPQQSDLVANQSRPDSESVTAVHSSGRNTQRLSLTHCQLIVDGIYAIGVLNDRNDREMLLFSVNNAAQVDPAVVNVNANI